MDLKKIIVRCEISFDNVVFICGLALQCGLDLLYV